MKRILLLLGLFVTMPAWGSGGAPSNGMPVSSLFYTPSEIAGMHYCGTIKLNHPVSVEGMHLDNDGQWVPDYVKEQTFCDNPGCLVMHFKTVPNFDCKIEAKPIRTDIIKQLKEKWRGEE